MSSPVSPSPDTNVAEANVRDEPDAGELEGEQSEQSQIGIMYSERTWEVPPSVKTATFWIGLLLLGGLASFEVSKRAEFRELLVDSVVEPEDWGNAPAPEIALPALYKDGKDGGGDLKLSDFKGRWVLVNFWATWCAPCRDEMPSLEMLNRRFGDRVVMLAVSVDDDTAQVARFFGDTKPSFAVLWDKDKQFTRTYGTSKFPETYLVSPDGRIAAKFTGPRDWYNQGMVQYFADVVSKRRTPIRS
jgi:thiol-disulfide isomerase/thioredoxin